MSDSEQEYSESVDVSIEVLNKEPLTVQVSMLNQGTGTAYIEKRNAPLDGVLAGQLFIVHNNNGQEVEYTGAMAKLSSSSKADCIPLEPGESLRFAVVIGDYYQFANLTQLKIKFDATNFVDDLELMTDLSSQWLKIELN